MSEHKSPITGSVLAVMTAVALVSGLTGCQTSAGHTTTKARRTTRAAAPRLTEQQDQLLRIIEDDSLPVDERRRALSKLKTRATSACVPRLVELLPGKWNSLTYEILGILRKLRDPAALPTLEAMQASLEAGPGNRRHAISTSLVRALDRAIDACRRGKRLAIGD
ncbi:MAG: hypothetical protein ACYSXF_08070 [Planctomycetota bacterium]|jgi:hypothetical protein